MIIITELAFIYYISIKINLKMSIGVWSTLPIFLPIHLHGSLQCHAQLTYPFTFIKLSILKIIFQKTNMCTHIYIYMLVYHSMQLHLHADLVYRSVHFYNWHSSNTHTHSFNYFSSQQIGNTNIHTHMDVIKTCK